MQIFYSEESLGAVSSRLNRRFTVLAVVAAVLLAVFIWAVITRVEWLAMAAATLAGVFAVFFVDLFCMPLIRYRRLMRSALQGRTHTKALEFDHAEAEISSVDGIPCRSLIFLGDPDKHGSRETLFYWDNEIPLPELEPGTVYTLAYTGKNIIGLQKGA